MKAIQRFRRKFHSDSNPHARVESAAIHDPETTTVENSVFTASHDPPKNSTGDPIHVFRLCKTCERLLHVIFYELGERHSFPPDLAELRDEPPTGCRFCYLRWQMISPEERAKLQGCQDVGIKFHSWHSGGVITIKYPHGLGDGEFFAAIGCQACLSLSLDREPSSSSLSTFSAISNWIDFCNINHEKCKEASPIASLVSKCPAGRILDLTATPEEHVRLVNGDEVASPYVTLSHCWGDFQPPILTEQNRQQYQKGIDPASLPRTFVDAIDITRRLGINYLWIDCLCVIQDTENDKDWRIESAKMEHIYQHAWLNIAASKAEDARGGCYSSREPRDVAPVVVNVPYQLSRRFSQPHVIFDTKMWEINVEDSKLMHRAWVQQEQFLSRRTLHFAKHQVFWRCQELQACETFPGGMPTHGIYSNTEDAYRVLFLQPNGANLSSNPQDYILSDWSSHQQNFSVWEGQNLNLRKDHPQHELFNKLKSNREILKTWSEIVQEYTACRLSYPEKDKLVAISSLARRCGKGDDYLAGLWKPTLPWQLLWQVVEDKDDKGLPHSRLLGPPSWSWASVHRRVFMHDHQSFRAEQMERDMLIINICNAETSLVSNDPFGQVEGGSIKVSGFVTNVPVATVRRIITDWGACVTKNHWKHVIYCEDDLCLPFDDSNGIFLAILKSTIELTGIFNGSFSEEDRSVATVQGLWLEPTGSKAGEYRRRGTFVFPVEACRLWPQRIEQFYSQKLRPEDYELYEGMQTIGCVDNEKEYHRYSITIV